MKQLTMLVAFVLAIGPWFAMAQTAPTQPQDPTARAPATTAPNPGAATAKESQAPADSDASPSSPVPTKAKSRPFMGRILRKNGTYVLRAGDLEYKLDDQNQARDYNGKNVKVTGNLDKQTNTIHVQKIESSPSM